MNLAGHPRPPENGGSKHEWREMAVNQASIGRQRRVIEENFRVCGAARVLRRDINAELDPWDAFARMRNRKTLTSSPVEAANRWQVHRPQLPR